MAVPASGSTISRCEAMKGPKRSIIPIILHHVNNRDKRTSRFAARAPPRLPPSPQPPSRHSPPPASPPSPHNPHNPPQTRPPPDSTSDRNNDNASSHPSLGDDRDPSPQDGNGPDATSSAISPSPTSTSSSSSSIDTSSIANSSLSTPSTSVSSESFTATANIAAFSASSPSPSILSTTVSSPPSKATVSSVIFPNHRHSKLSLILGTTFGVIFGLLAIATLIILYYRKRHSRISDSTGRRQKWRSRSSSKFWSRNLGPDPRASFLDLSGESRLCGLRELAETITTPGQTQNIRPISKGPRASTAPPHGLAATPLRFLSGERNAETRNQAVVASLVAEVQHFLRVTAKPSLSRFRPAGEARYNSDALPRYDGK